PERRRAGREGAVPRPTPQRTARRTGRAGLVMRAATLGLLAVLSAAGAAFAQDHVRVWSTLSARAVPIGGTTVLELHIETSGAAPQRIEAPALPPEVEVVGTRDYSQIRFSLPGGRTRLVRRELVL